MPANCRNLIIILGDQLDRDSAVWDDFSVDQDVAWMAEVTEESSHVWSHKARIALFLAGMRHFRNGLRRDGIAVQYRELDDGNNSGSFASELRLEIARLRPRKLVVVEPGEFRVRDALLAAAGQCGVPLEIRPDTHFFCSTQEFAEYAQGKKQLRLEYFYREMRQRHDILMQGDKPVGGKWNFDKENRRAFGKEGPGKIPAPHRFPPDRTTREVLELVERRFPEHPGSLEHFDWPVTPRDALTALDDFVANRLADFGRYQDAMWQEEPFLYHSRLSAALNLKLLNPRTVIERAVEAYHAGAAPLNAVEGFVRQILGWREYVRGIYWHYMPEYLERNALNADAPLPEFYWTGDTPMVCLHQTIRQTLNYGYAHHIQRLMVTGLFALLLGVDPREVHRWYLAVYVDAVEWVELPNTLGMSQFADGGIMASKPYSATGKYIERMSNYCAACPFDPRNAVGEDACPFTTLYWDFLVRHRGQLEQNHRMGLQLKNVDRKSPTELSDIGDRAERLRNWVAGREGAP